jgi:nitrogen-specific signal transduction histidine kinase
MNWLRKESVRYALLLVVLLATAAIAVGVTLNYIYEIVPQKEHLTVVTIAIWAQTMGFMLIAGAFGLWAVHFTAETESLRRLGSLVDAMDYISDGVIALNRQGRATGMNPAALAIFGESARHAVLTDFCPALPGPVLHAFLHSDTPVEAEVELADSNRTRTLRFRSQPSQGIVILLASDVTDLVRRREQTRRKAYIQLVGHMAKGVANDFNDLLCGISGHASLLARHNLRNLDIPASAAAIQDCANRGMQLARQLIQLAEPNAGESIATLQTALHINAGLDLLTASLPGDWSIDRVIADDVPPVSIPPAQLENLVQSLGLLTADSAPSTRHLTVTLSSPVTGGSGSGTAVLLSFATAVSPGTDEKRVPQDMETAGVIASVINTLILQSGGKMESYTSAGGAAEFRVFIPEADATSLAAESPENLTMGLEAYAANWHILMDSDIRGSEACADYFQRIGIHTRKAQGIVHILGAIESNDRLDAIALGGNTLGDDMSSLTKAIGRLAPQAGIVVQQRHLPADGMAGVVYVPEQVTPGQLLHAMIEARSSRRALANRPSQA